MTRGDKGKLFNLFVALFILSLPTQQDCVLPVVSFSFLYGYGAPLGGPSGRRSSAINVGTPYSEAYADVFAAPDYISHADRDNCHILRKSQCTALISLRTQTYFRLSLVFGGTSDSRKYVCVRRLGADQPADETPLTWAKAQKKV